MDFCGLYKITNKINGKCYVGQSVNILVRWRQHLTQPFNKKSNSYNNLLYRAIRKYGVNNFVFEIIELCDVSELNEKEIYYIGKFNAYESGYNMTIGGSDFSCTTQKCIDQYDLEGNLLNTYNSVSEAKRKTGVKHISGVLLGERCTAGGFYWSYHGEGFRPKRIKTHYTSVVQYDLRGNFIKEFSSIKEAIEETGATGITYACVHHTKAGKWLWCYKGDKVIPYTYPKYKNKLVRPVNCFSQDGKLVATYFSLAEAERKTNISYANISACCCGKRKTTGGYFWSFADENEKG